MEQTKAKLIRISSAGKRFPGKSFADLLTDIMRRGKPCRFTAHGFSMFPFIRDGDVVTVSPVGDESLKTGDIVAFSHPEDGGLVIHRIVKKGAGGYRIKGDSTFVSDGVLPAEKIIGKVVVVERRGRAFRPGRGLPGWLTAFFSYYGLLQKFLIILERGKIIRPRRTM